jgi:hypothetical protein
MVRWHAQCVRAHTVSALRSSIELRLPTVALSIVCCYSTAAAAAAVLSVYLHTTHHGCTLALVPLQVLLLLILAQVCYYRMPQTLYLIILLWRVTTATVHTAEAVVGTAV